jgi:hypothetical protein
MTCEGILCKHEATTHRAITNTDGSVTAWNLCEAHATAYDLDLGDREAKNAADDAQREADWRYTHGR